MCTLFYNRNLISVNARDQLSYRNKTTGKNYVSAYLDFEAPSTNGWAKDSGQLLLLLLLLLTVIELSLGGSTDETRKKTYA
jgi:hypothetical protein